LKLSLLGNFEAVFFAPAGCKKACVQIRPILAVDGTYTRSKYRMQLLIAVGIDANSNGVPVCWALVPIENEYWWTWFFENMLKALPGTANKSYMFISDREKGLGPVLAKVYLLAFYAYCCQYIADNIQTQFGIRSRSPFWACARSKNKLVFDKALAELYKINAKAGEYIDSILYKYWAR
jgi:hypothetical protein